MHTPFITQQSTDHAIGKTVTVTVPVPVPVTVTRKTKLASFPQ